MSRLGRTFLPDQPLHVIQRGNNRGATFFREDDYARYRGWLAEARELYRCRIHAYVFMTNHVHLLASPASEESIPKTLQSVGRRYVQYFNFRYQRTGTLWEGRYRATIVEAETYLFECMRYIELNPVRAGMVRHPSEHSWSSYQANAGMIVDPMVKPHRLYRGLGITEEKRHEAYVALVREPMEAQMLKTIRDSTNKGWAMGGGRFKSKIETLTDRRVDPLPKGRPKREKSD